MTKLAPFYSTERVETHGAYYCAYYMGRNNQHHGDPKASRAVFKCDADYQAYKAGWRSSAAETRLDNDTEWDD